MTMPHARGATARPQGPHLFMGSARPAAERGTAFERHAAQPPGRTTPVHANARSAHTARPARSAHTARSAHAVLKEPPG
ncbi:hypothetical protein ACPYPG_35575 [Streptomyces sp. FR-108]|uniref:hypothetical protein n=1 Tax=Streptomyces sp. FR-108 TaxID=3416665 RepID=UPI003CEF015F